MKKLLSQRASLYVTVLGLGFIITKIIDLVAPCGFKWH